MFSILPLHSSAIRRASVAVAGVVLLTACDNDNPVAPKSSPTPSAAQPAVIGSNRPAVGRVRQTYVDVVGPVAGMSLRLRNHAANTSTDFRENFTPDIDPAIGKLELKLPEGEYSLCVMAAPLGYWLVGVQAGYCFWFQVKRDSIVNLPTVTSYPFFSTYWGVSDGPDAEFNMNPIGPSTFTVKNALTWETITVVDNGTNDFDPRLGMFALKLDWAGDFDICQTQAPVGYYNTFPSCKRITVVSTTPEFAGWWINAKKGSTITRK